MEVGDFRGRAEISKAKKMFLAAACAVLEKRRSFWPVSDRAIHYALLNNPPLIHASKPDSTHANNQRSYKSLVELLTRARPGSSRTAAFVKKYGNDVYELEAIPPADLQELTREAIESVLDMKAFEHEIEQEKSDATQLTARHGLVLRALGE